VQIAGPGLRPGLGLDRECGISLPVPVRCASHFAVRPVKYEPAVVGAHAQYAQDG